MLRKFLIAVFFVGVITPVIADTECPVGYGYTTLVEATVGGCVDLGSLSWTYNSAYDYFDAREFNPSTNYFTTRYSYYGIVSANHVMETVPTGVYLNSRYSCLNIKDTSFGSNVEQFKQAMSGVILYYQRATDESWTPPSENTVCLDTSSYNLYGQYVLPEKCECTLCPPNTYKDSVGNSVCTPCPSGTLSPAGATSVDQCGRILHVGNYNVFMPVGRRTEHGLCTMLNGVKYCADLYEKE